MQITQSVNFLESIRYFRTPLRKGDSKRIILAYLFVEYFLR